MLFVGYTLQFVRITAGSNYAVTPLRVNKIMFCRIDCVTYKMGVNGSKTTSDATEVAFQAVDKRHLRKLKKAMAKRNNGAALDCQRSSTSSSGSGDDTHEMSLLEYAVEKDWLEGVARMLKVYFSLARSLAYLLPPVKDQVYSLRPKSHFLQK